MDGFNLEGTRETGGNVGRDKVSLSVDQKAILKAWWLAAQWKEPEEQLQGKDRRCMKETRSVLFKINKELKQVSAFDSHSLGHFFTLKTKNVELNHKLLKSGGLN